MIPQTCTNFAGSRREAPPKLPPLTGSRQEQYNKLLTVVTGKQLATAATWRSFAETGDTTPFQRAATPSMPAEVSMGVVWHERHPALTMILSCSCTAALLQAPLSCEQQMCRVG